MVNLDFVSINLTAKGMDQAVVPGIELAGFLVNRSTSPQVRGVSFYVELSAFGSSIAATQPWYFETLAQNEHKDFRFFVPMPHYLLQAIETRRVDDVPLSLAVKGLCLSQQGGQPQWERVSGSIEYPRSQKQWIDLLRGLGYAERWVFETDLPRIIGFESVGQYVLKASEAIQQRDYEGAVHNCRVAWDAANPLLEGLEKDMAGEIDRNSPGESGFPQKSQRISALRKDILAWSQIGAHKESYGVTAEDALLCYRLTLSMFSYLTRVVSGLKRP